MASSIERRLERIERILEEINSKIENFLGYETPDADEIKEIERLREEISMGKVHQADFIDMD